MPSRLDAIRARLAAATQSAPLPWEAQGSTFPCLGAGTVYRDECAVPVATCPRYVHAVLIAHAPADLAALLAVAEAAADMDPCEQGGDGLIAPYCYTHHGGRPCCGDRLREAVAALTTKEID